MKEVPVAERPRTKQSQHYCSFALMSLYSAPAVQEFIDNAKA